MRQESDRLLPENCAGILAYALSCNAQDEENLWSLVLRQALGTSNTFADIVRRQSAIELAHLDAVLKLDILTLRKGLFPLWGEQMGRVKKSFTYNWVQKRISDYQANRFPRSLILLLQPESDIRYSVAELYLSGLKMTRLGQR